MTSFEESGAVVGGGAVLGATLGFIVGSLLHDLLPGVDPDEWVVLVGLPWRESAPDGAFRRHSPPR